MFNLTDDFSLFRTFLPQDLINVLGKLQRHKVFEEEVKSSENHVQECMSTAESLIADGNCDEEEVRVLADGVKKAWDVLLEKCNIKGIRIEAAVRLLSVHLSK